MFKVILLASALMDVTALPTPEVKSSPVTDWLIYIVAQTAPGDLEKTKQRLGGIFDTASLGAAQIDGQSMKVRRMSQAADRRAQFIQSLLRKDLNGDGVLTKEDLDLYYTPESRGELRSNTGVLVSPTPEQSAEIIRTAETKDFAYDTDGDGKVTFAEILAAASKAIDASQAIMNSARVTDENLMALDANGDGILTRDEFFAAVAEAHKKIDANGDGTISRDEMSKVLLKLPRP